MVSIIKTYHLYLSENKAGEFLELGISFCLDIGLKVNKRNPFLVYFNPFLVEFPVIAAERKNGEG